MLARKIAARAAARLIRPDDLVAEIALAEDFVHQKPQVRVHAPVDMYENQRVGGHQRPRVHQHGAHFFKVGFPRQAVVIRAQRQRAAAAFPFLRAHAHARFERFAREKRRVEVDKVHLALIGFPEPPGDVRCVAQMEFVLGDSFLRAPDLPVDLRQMYRHRGALRFVECIDYTIFGRPCPYWERLSAAFRR